MNIKILKLLLAPLLILYFCQSGFSNKIIKAGEFTFKNNSQQDATIFLNLDKTCQNSIPACKNTNDNNCLYLEEKDNYYLSITIPKKSNKNLAVMYKYDKEEPQEKIDLCLSILNDNKYETYHSVATYHSFPSLNFYLINDKGSIQVDGDNTTKSKKKNYNECKRRLLVHEELIADLWVPTYYKTTITIIK